MAHKKFDKLSRCRDPKRRLRTDVISKEWLDWLDGILDTCKDIRKFTDKFVAHAADQLSRSDLTATQTGVTLDGLHLCHKAIYQVAAFVYGPLLWEGVHGVLPTPQYDHLENFGKAWVAKDDVNAAHEHWSRRRASIEEWESLPQWPVEDQCNA